MEGGGVRGDGERGGGVFQIDDGYGHFQRVLREAGFGTGHGVKF